MFIYYREIDSVLGTDSQNKIYVLSPGPEVIDPPSPHTQSSSIVRSDEIKAIFSKLNIVPDADALIKVDQVTCQHFASYQITNCQMIPNQLAGKALQITGEIAFNFFQTLSASGVPSGISGPGQMQYLATRNIVCDSSRNGSCTIKSFP